MRQSERAARFWEMVKDVQAWGYTRDQAIRRCEIQFPSEYRAAMKQQNKI